MKDFEKKEDVIGEANAFSDFDDDQLRSVLQQLGVPVPNGWRNAPLNIRRLRTEQLFNGGLTPYGFETSFERRTERPVHKEDLLDTKRIKEKIRGLHDVVRAGKDPKKWN